VDAGILHGQGLYMAQGCYTVQGFCTTVNRRSVRLLLTLGALLFGAWMASAQAPAADAQSEGYGLDAPGSFYPRLEASEGEKALISYLQQTLSEQGITFQPFDFQGSEDMHSFSSNLEATVTGGRRDTIIVCAPLNHGEDHSAGESGAVNLLLALRWLRQARQRDIPVTLKFLFLGAEFGQGPGYPMGSRLFLEEFYPDAPVAVIYLNMRKIPERVLLSAAGDRRVAPLWLVRSALQSLDEARVPFRIRGEDIQLSRIGVPGEKPIADPYLQAGYAAMELTDLGSGAPDLGAENSARTDDDWLTRMDRFFWNLVDSRRDGIPESWDKHYLVFQNRLFHLIIPESIYLVLLGATLGLSILAIQVYYRRFLVYYKWVLQNAWFLLLLLLFCFAFLLISTLALEGIQVLRSNGELWKGKPLLFLFQKFLLFGFLWVAFTPLRVRLPYARRKKFFSSAALLFLFLDVVILSLFNISFSYYFIWAYFFVFLLALVRRRFLKVLFLAVSSYWLAKFCLEMFLRPEWEICRVILLSRYWGNLLLSAFILPYVLLLMKVSLLFPPSPRREKIARRSGTALLGLASAACIAYSFLFSPYSSRRPQIIRAVNSIDSRASSNNLILSSPAALGRIGYRYADRYFETDTREKRIVTGLELRPDLLSAKVSRSTLLNRQNVELLLEAEGRPYQMELHLSSEEGFILFGANYAIVREVAPEEEGVRYRILVGKNPPNPLRLLLTLPREGTFTLAVDITYRDPPFPMEFSGEHKDFRVELVYHEEIEIA
jgi:hypothetical protein